MNIMITGAAGHIGSYLIRSLPQSIKIDKILLVDNMISNRYCSFFSLPENVNYKFIHFDLAKNDFDQLPHSDIVLHFAAKTDAAQSAKFKDEFYSNNLEATKNVIKYCVKNNSKLIFASTTSVYGPQNQLVDENCPESELNPQSPYADVKLLEENIIQNHPGFKNDSYLIFRMGTIYGFSDGIRFHTAVNKFCFQASTGVPITIWRTAYEQKRPYLGLDDLNSAILYMIKHNIFDNRIYNLVSANCTVKNIVDIIKKYVPNIKIEYVNHEIMNQLSYEISNERFKKKGFDFNSNVEREIKNTIKSLDKMNYKNFR